MTTPINTPMNHSTLGGKPIYDPCDEYTGTVNYFTCQTGASNYGYGRFLMQRRDYDSLTSPATLSLSDSSNNINFQVILAGVLPHSADLPTVTQIGAAAPTSLSTNLPSDMVEVVVVDQRAISDAILTSAYNVQQDGFTSYYASTLNTGTPYTWAQVATALGMIMPASPIAAPTWTPRNLIFDGLQKTAAIDDVAARLSLVVGYDFTNTANITYWCPGVAHPDNTDLIPDAMLARLEGYMGSAQAARLPTTYNVLFKASTDEADPYAHRFYSKVVTATAGVVGTSRQQVIHVGDWPAVRAAGSWTESASMDAIAQDVANRVNLLASQPQGDFEFAGIWPFKLDGLVRSITWRSDVDGARTSIRCNNDTDFIPPDQRERAMETLQQWTVGLGSTNASMTTSGQAMVWRGGGVTASTAKARLTAVTGSFPQWSYTAQLITSFNSSVSVNGGARFVTTGTNITGILNTDETASASSPYVYGNGVPVDSGGTVSGGSCVIQPIGLGIVVDVTQWVNQNGGGAVYTFGRPNSAN